MPFLILLLPENAYSTQQRVSQVTHDMAELRELSRVVVFTVLFPVPQGQHPSHPLQEAGLDPPNAEYTLPFSARDTGIYNNL